MRINNEKLKELSAMSDANLWAEIVKMGKGFGFSIPEKTPPQCDMKRIRDALNGSKINIGEAMTLLRNYGGKKSDERK